MRRTVHVVVACLVIVAALARAADAAGIPSPSEFLGIKVGADRTIADYRQIASYFKALDAARRASRSRSSARRHSARRCSSP